MKTPKDKLTPLYSCRAHGIWLGETIFRVQRGKQQVFPYVPAADPKTERQQGWRQTFKRAVQAWHDLTAAEKKTYDRWVVKYSICRTGFNQFLSEYMKREAGMGWPDPHRKTHEPGGSDEIEKLPAVSSCIDITSPGANIEDAVTKKHSHLTAMFAAKSTSASGQAIPINTWLDIAFNQEIFDTGDDYANNVFTAPIDGKYQINLTAKIYNIDTAATFYNLKINATNSFYILYFDPNYTADLIYQSDTLSALIDMDANDTAKCQVYQVGGTAQSKVAQSTTEFSGFLVQ